MHELKTTRRTLIGGTVGLAVASRATAAPLPKLPTSPVALTVIDAGGSLQMTRQGFEDYAHANPHLVSSIRYAMSPPAELAGKIWAEQAGGQVDIDLCLCGNDLLAAGLAEDLWLRLLPDYAAELPDLKSSLSAGRAGRCRAWRRTRRSAWCSARPGRSSNTCPTRVKTPPKTAQELLAWAKAHPKRFLLCAGRPIPAQAAPSCRACPTS